MKKTFLIMSMVTLVLCTVSAQSNDTEPGINDFYIPAVSPKTINKMEVVREIGYPQAAKDLKQYGDLIVRILVGREGEYVKHQILKSPHDIFSKAVEKHLPQLKFSPAQNEDGAPIMCWVNVPFRFKQIIIDETTGKTQEFDEKLGNKTTYSQKTRKKKKRKDKKQ